MQIAKKSTRSELTDALGACRAALVGAGVMSAVVSVLSLTGSFFMLEIYDRVIPSRSMPTLVALMCLASVLFMFQGLLEATRTRILLRIGSFLDEALASRVFGATLRIPLVKPGAPDPLLALRDFDQVRSFFASAGLTALFDLPWIPLYLAICFLFHPLIGTAALVGAVLLVVFTISTELSTRRLLTESVRLARRRHSLAEAGVRNAEASHSMGMADNVARAWRTSNSLYLATHQRAADIATAYGAAARTLRIGLQSGVLAIGAYLVIEGQATAGIIIAASILTSRALAPVELAIAHWRGFVAARQSWKRLRDLLAEIPPEPEPLPLPAPASRLSVESISVVPPASQKLILQDISFALEAGQALGIIGASASGKSTLARTLVGVWPAARGKVRLDGASFEQWSPRALGRHIGYLPQDVELFAGTIAENIARFDLDPAPEDIIAAAKAAHVHDMILRLPGGFETQVGEDGVVLSAGQRQRIALARALYRDPRLVVLDEPNSHLDHEGDSALSAALLGVKARGGIAIVVAHRPSALAAIDLLLLLGDGRTVAFGPKDEILQAPKAPAPEPSAAREETARSGGLRIVGEATSKD